MSATTDEMTWDLTPWFGGELGPAYAQQRAAFVDGLEALIARADQLGPLEAASVGAWGELLAQIEALYKDGSHLRSFLHCASATRAADQAIQGEVGAFASVVARYEQLQARCEAALCGAAEADFAALEAHPALEGLSFWLHNTRAQGQMKMPVELEKLASALSVTGLAAWGRLYSKLTGTMEVPLEVEGEAPRRVPLSHVRSLMEDPSAQVRRAALEGANAELERWQDVFAAALNAIAGHRLTLNQWRGVDHFLTPPLFQARISRRTLEAMQEAIKRSQELPRRYLRQKAALLGLERLGFQDLSSPLPLPDHGAVSWEEAWARIERAFDAHDPELGAFARRARQDRWVDARPGAGRSPGGFCTSSASLEQSRIFMTYRGTLGDIQTLAHELGHAFHNHAMNGMRAWSRGYPMTLAETASTYAEAVLTDALLHDPASDDAARALILDTRLENAASFLLNIPMRFDFEVAFYEERARGPVSVERCKALMRQAQRDNYGDVLDPEQLDPWFWASKLHFYITEVSFYNYPYSFGYLFSLAVLTRVKQGGEGAFGRYKALLRDTGRASAEEVAARHLGADLGDPEFWLEPMQIIADDLARFEALAPEVLKGPR